MNIKRPNISKKVTLISIISILAVALLAVGGWSFVAIQAESDFVSGISKLRQQLKTDLEKGSQVMKLASEKHDTAVMSKVLDSLSNRLDADIASAPEPWQVLDVSFVSQNKINDKNGLVDKVDALISALRSASRLLTYENQVIEPLLTVKNLTGKTLQEQQSLAAGWLDLLEKLKKITPPDTVSELHASIIKVVSDTQVILAAIPPLYEKKNQAGFTAKNAELQISITKLQSLHQAVRSVDAMIDKTAGEAYHTLGVAIE